MGKHRRARLGMAGSLFRHDVAETIHIPSGCSATAGQILVCRSAAEGALWEPLRLPPLQRGAVATLVHEVGCCARMCPTTHQVVDVSRCPTRQRCFSEGGRTNHRWTMVGGLPSGRLQPTDFRRLPRLEKVRLDQRQDKRKRLLSQTPGPYLLPCWGNFR